MESLEINDNDISKQNMYEKYYKERFHNDPTYRARFYDSLKKYRDKHKDEPEVLEKHRIYQKQLYDTNDELRERKKAKALERYNRLKHDPEFRKLCSERVQRSVAKRKARELNNALSGLTLSPSPP